MYNQTYLPSERLSDRLLSRLTQDSTDAPTAISLYHYLLPSLSLSCAIYVRAGYAACAYPDAVRLYHACTSVHAHIYTYKQKGRRGGARKRSLQPRYIGGGEPRHPRGQVTRPTFSFRGGRKIHVCACSLSRAAVRISANWICRVCLGNVNIVQSARVRERESVCIRGSGRYTATVLSSEREGNRLLSS